MTALRQRADLPTPPLGSVWVFPSTFGAICDEALAMGVRVVATLRDEKKSAHISGDIGMGQLGVGGGFSIDMADAHTFITALKDKVASLQNTLLKYAEPLQIPAPGRDDYSGGWSDDAQTSVNDYIAWNEGLQQTLNSLVGQAQAAVAQYQQTEEHNTMGS
jgi:hypothetical protein